jgi:Heparinase II/III-like protein/Heparinase II/III N-terminus
MSNSTQKLWKVKQLSVAELRVRGTQALNAFLERRGWSPVAKLPPDQSFLELIDPAKTPPGLRSAPELLEYFRTRSQPRFFVSFADPHQTVGELRARWPDAERQIIIRADRIVEGRFDLLGLHDLSFGEPLDWQLEPVSGKRTPLMHWSRLNYLDAELTGDKKIVWELNRHQYFASLGQAYWLTGDERYARTVVAHLNSWMDQNPPKLGINWASSLEVSFRAISWLWAFYFFKDSAELTAPIFLRVLKFLYLHARHLETYLSTYFSPNTHLTGEALGLFYLGTLLPEFRPASRWRETGRRILLEELTRHVQADGVYFEQSSYYHRYTTDFYTHFLILSRENGETLPGVVSEKLNSLLEHLMYVTRPDGTTPLFGDDDGGRLVMLDQRASNNFRATLSNGAALFNRGDYKHVAGQPAEETLWLLGTKGLAAFDRVVTEEPASRSIAFPVGGYYVMRDGWTPASNYLLLDCGPHGMNNCGHAHADALSFELTVGGRTLLVDPGTYTYTGSRELRDWFRSSVAHNTLTVDGESSSVPAGPFSWSAIAQCATEKWTSRQRFDYFAGRHNGYARLPRPVIHSRGVLFLRGDYWVMRDSVESNGEHRYDLWFHFDSDAAPMLQNAPTSAPVVTESDGPAGLEIVTFANNGKWRTEKAWVSHCYGERRPAPVCVFSTTTMSVDLITFLLPRTESKPRQAREIEAIGGRAFEVVSESAHDMVMIGTGARVETARLASDFEWTWAKFANEDAAVPEELVLIGGHLLELQGKEVLRSARRINYLVASRLGDQFRIETDDGVLELRLPIHDFESAFANRQSTMGNRQ